MKAISKNLTFSGIYCIINLVNNKKYIGSSKNIRTRLWCHRAELRHGHHDNCHLQRAWNKYGESNFDFYIIEKCEESLLLEREQFYIDTQSPEYNINPITTKPPVTEETRRKQSITRKLKMSTGEIPITHNRVIHQYDLEGNYIREYKSIRQAAADNNMNVSQIQNNLKGKYRQGGGFIWSYTKEDSLPKYVRNNSKPCRTKVVVYNDTERFEFDGVTKCAKHFDVHPTYIWNAIKHSRRFLRKYTINYI